MATRNPNRIVSPMRTAVVGHDQHGWTAHSNEIKILLGITGPLPADGLPAVYIQGVRVWVNSLALAKERGQFHRVRCACPECGQEMSVGRLQQHVCATSKESS